MILSLPPPSLPRFLGTNSCSGKIGSARISRQLRQRIPEYFGPILLRRFKLLLVLQLFDDRERFSERDLRALHTDYRVHLVKADGQIGVGLSVAWIARRKPAGKVEALLLGGKRPRKSPAYGFM